MNTHLDTNKLLELAGSILDKNQEFSLGHVCELVKTAQRQFPEDVVISQVAYALEKRTDRSPDATITKNEVYNIYNQFARVSSSSRFRDQLGFLLPREQERKQEKKIASRIECEEKIKMEDLIDPKLAAAISSVFDNNVAVSDSVYDRKIAKAGQAIIKAELKALGLGTPTTEIMGGNQYNIIYAANFNTNLGMVSVAIPAEIAKDKILFPSTFVADDALKELTNSNIKDFVGKKASKRDFSVPKASDVLYAVGQITGKFKDMEKNAFSLMADSVVGEEKDYMFSGYYEDEVDNFSPHISGGINIGAKKVAVPKELAHLSRDFEEDLLETTCTAGKDAIQRGKKIIAIELASAGLKNAQIKFGCESGDSVVYLASINTAIGPVEIEIPVEMKSMGDRYVPLVPTHFAYDGLVEEFVPSRLQRFASNVPSPSTNSVASYSFMTLSEIKNEIVKSAAKEDYNSCETALAEIRKTFGEDHFKNAFSDYQFALIQKAKVANTVNHKCLREIPAGKGSIYARCGHFGVPMHLVTADEEGNCKLVKTALRERMRQPENEGAAISTSKIMLT